MQRLWVDQTEFSSSISLNTNTASPLVRWNECRLTHLLIERVNHPNAVKLLPMLESWRKKHNSIGSRTDLMSMVQPSAFV